MKKRREINRALHAELSDKIVRKLLASKKFTSYSSYFVYVSTEDEVATEVLIDALLKSGKRVFAPRTEGDEIAAVEIFEKTTAWTRGAFGIPEPTGQAYTGEIDLCVVPMVAFSKTLGRLGHGKGYYDRFFNRFSVIKLGVAFEYQREDALPTEPHDVPMDAVVTEAAVYFGKGRE